ncbi:hypothetical protein EV421DRAFT_1739577 [Armillaria borealis]|uniref:ABC transporter domain-containing protein n=1 Tax=Armillaria borealis TaxID=47425 RepID=A0AA39MIQ7_9AGAR|nr:hypothetical protein EV421DRAFT_1739577 [Armillaria borealis]
MEEFEGDNEAYRAIAAYQSPERTRPMPPPPPFGPQSTPERPLLLKRVRNRALLPSPEIEKSRSWTKAREERKNNRFLGPRGTQPMNLSGESGQNGFHQSRYYAFTDNDFKGRFFNCPLGDAATDPNCVNYPGDFIINSLAVLNMTCTYIPICAIIGIAVSYVIGQVLFLHFFKVNISMLGSKECPEDKSRHASSLTPVTLTPNSIVGIDVDLTDYTLKVHPRRGRDVKILQGITSCFEAGKINVILGPSGSGKFSLLNLMAQRLQSTLQTTYVAGGTMTLNGVPAKPEVMSTLCSYVTQDNSALLPYLTVRETSQFAASLRLPSSLSKEEKRHRADEVMLKMGLKDCRHTLIGNELLKGISGGEKRRVSIAVQVLTEPQGLMLDEPTSGLNVFTAASILDVLAQFAKEGRTIIMTLHQRSSELYKAVGWHTPVPQARCSTMSFECPSMMNPTDFALDVVSVDTREAEREELGRVKFNKLVKAFKDRQEAEGHISPLSERQMEISTNFKGYERKMLSIATALPVLLKRVLLACRLVSNLSSHRLEMTMRASNPALVVFRKPLPLFFIGILQNVAVFPIERDFFYREYDDGVYSVEAFLTSYAALELPFEIVTASIYSLFVSISANLGRTVPIFFITALNGLCIVNAGESLGMIMNTFLTQDTGLALNITNILMSIAVYMAGLLSLNMPGFLKYLNKLNPLGYSVRNMMPYVLRGQMFSCGEDQMLTDGSCAISTGEQVLEIFNLKDVNAPLNLCTVVISAVVYRLLAYAVLKLVKTCLVKFPVLFFLPFPKRQDFPYVQAILSEDDAPCLFFARNPFVTGRRLVSENIDFKAEISHVAIPFLRNNMLTSSEPECCIFSIVPRVYEGVEALALRLFIKGQGPYSAPAIYLPLKTVPGRGLLRRHDVSTSGERGVPMRLLGVIHEEVLKRRPSARLDLASSSKPGAGHPTTRPLLPPPLGRFDKVPSI